MTLPETESKGHTVMGKPCEHSFLGAVTHPFIDDIAGVTEWSRGPGASAWGSVGGQSPSRVPSKPPTLSVTGVDHPGRPGLRQEGNTPGQSLKEVREAILLTSLQWVRQILIADLLHVHLSEAII